MYGAKVFVLGIIAFLAGLDIKFLDTVTDRESMTPTSIIGMITSVGFYMLMLFFGSDVFNFIIALTIGLIISGKVDVFEFKMGAIATLFTINLLILVGFQEEVNLFLVMQIMFFSFLDELFDDKPFFRFRPFLKMFSIFAALVGWSSILLPVTVLCFDLGYIISSTRTSKNSVSNDQRS